MLAQIRHGYHWLQFSQPFEREYRRWRFQGIKERTRPVGLSVIVLFLLYSIVDYQVFPDQIYLVSISLRLFLVCPVVGVLIWASYQDWSESKFLKLYMAAYLVTGLGLCLMIFASHLQKFWMPYDGLLLLLMGGYFLFGMPFWHIVIASWLYLPMYAAFESFTPFPVDELQYNLVFMATANCIGMVGVYLLEYNHRTLFLNRLLLQLGMQKAAADSLAKSRFIAAASHDLRQPLHALHLMLENLAEEVPDAHRRLVMKAQESASQLGSMMGSILDQSKLSFGVVKPERENFSLSGLLLHLGTEMQPAAERAGMELRYSGCDDAYTFTDRHLLERILRNLLTNAFNHSGGTRVALTLTSEQGVWLVSVKDDGKGIAEADRSVVFEEFNQGSQASGKAGRGNTGVGLGLAIVRQLSDLLGMTLTLASEPGAGCEFTLRIPKAQKLPERSEVSVMPPVAMPSTAPVLAKPLDGRRVLLVEDNRQACDSMAELLMKWGYACEKFYDAESVMASPHCPDIVVADYHLPNDRTGEQVLSDIHARFGEDIHGVIMTADMDVAKRIRHAGNYAVLNKPVAPVKLKMQLEQFQRLGE